MLAPKSYRRQPMNKSKIKRHLDALAQQDEVLRGKLSEYGYPPPRIREAGFETFLSIIVSQQISTASAAAVMRRLRAELPRLHAREILELGEEGLRAVGFSRPKIGYTLGLARAIDGGEFDVDALIEMDDDSAIESITALKGLGRWSAEIYLMFSLQRVDIFPAGHLALRVALQKLRGIEQLLSEKQARELMQDWAPYRSAGSLFLWHFYHGAPT